jgi:hypothetical protein
MIVFDLKCELNHVFEAWFSSSKAFDTQVRLGEIECPACGSTNVKKAVMAPNISKKTNQGTGTPEARVFLDTVDEEQVGYTHLPKPLQKELEGVLNKVRKHVEENCEYVGANFPEEVRKMHYGEAPERGIYGEASREESLDLLEEGIDVIPVPGIRKPRSTDA